MSAESEDLEYVGFCLRSLAALIDTLIITLIVSATLIVFSAGASNVLISWLLPAVATILFWMYRQATPGKMVVSASVVDARTGEPVTFWQGLLRYLGYFVSMLPLFSARSASAPTETENSGRNYGADINTLIRLLEEGKL